MSMKDVLKVLVMLGVAVAVVALYCYARVDLGMSLEQVNQRLEQWVGTSWNFVLLIWLQLFVAGAAGLAYKIWRHRSEVRRMANGGNPSNGV